MEPSARKQIFKWSMNQELKMVSHATWVQTEAALESLDAMEVDLVTNMAHSVIPMRVPYEKLKSSN